MFLGDLRDVRREQDLEDARWGLSVNDRGRVPSLCYCGAECGPLLAAGAGAENAEPVDVPPGAQGNNR